MFVPQRNTESSTRAVPHHISPYILEVPKKPTIVPSLLYRSRFPIGGRINLPCTVNSYSRPTVFWKKNGQRMRSDRRIQGRGSESDEERVARMRQANSRNRTPINCPAATQYRGQMNFWFPKPKPPNPRFVALSQSASATC